MEWLDRYRGSSGLDLKQLKFYADQLHPDSCTIQTVELRADGLNDGFQMWKREDHHSEEDFLRWAENIQTQPGKHCAPGLVLAMYPRLEGRHPTSGFMMGTTSLPCTEKTYLRVAGLMFQHSSISHVFKRISTALFISIRDVTWDGRSSWGPSIVYNCRSDTESAIGHDDVALSVTYFPKVSLAFAVMYGSTWSTRISAVSFLASFKRSGQAMHPLLLPVMFAEIERERLLNQLDRERTALSQKIEDMDNKLRSRQRGGDGGRSNGDIQEKDGEVDVVAVQDSAVRQVCDSTKQWMALSLLRNGMVSLRAQLENMLQHSGLLADTIFGLGLDGVECYSAEKRMGRDIDQRLEAMMDELDSKTGRVDGTLKGMELATQLEWNYYTKQDTKATLHIANSTMKDSGQMRTIALLGTIFLPGTFLVAFFSAGFFKWIPEDSNQVVSPWIGLWALATIILTSVTAWGLKKWIKKEREHAELLFKRDVCYMA